MNANSKRLSFYMSVITDHHILEFECSSIIIAAMMLFFADLSAKDVSTKFCCLLKQIC